MHPTAIVLTRQEEAETHGAVDEGPSLTTGQHTGSAAASTFNGPPLGLPSQDPLAIDLILMVAAHHGKRDHLLEKRRKSVLVT